ncbi:ATP-dependent zinc metalloprotease FtsH [Candidatus Berkelbacteria bacterium]|nr:ATP-dependent zinc metalloprotease FtsH [Candidatus Berkelbacteria bacterium]PIR28166.1 MAG: cell division protein FtsH [Candidatus Berkelbacteria bacterium CG11_big_fil_rev_8_21_14_0_20_40_23]
MNKQTKQALIFVAILLAILAVFQFADIGSPKTKESTITEIKQLVQDKKVSEIRVKGSKIEARVDGEVLIAYIEKSAQLSDYQITPDNVNIVVEDPDKGSLLPNLLTIFLPFLLIAGFLYFMLKSATGSNMRAMDFGRSKAQLYLGKHKISFADVAGAEEAKQELEEVVEFLRYPEKFRRLGAEIPKGVLLVGPPGTGKTLIARAVAGEAGVPFFSVSASEFVEMFVGVGAARTRDIFAKAKRNAPSIMFIDELDAIGRQRGSGLGGSHDEREQTLNQILVEMDGFDPGTKVVVMAATNRPDVLDPALLRPGRFDRRVMLDLPNKKERKAIFEVHLKNKPVDKTVNAEKIAQGTAGFSGADIKNVANEAAIFAARQNKKTISQNDLNWAVEKVFLGPERRSKVLSEKEKEITAYHEAGHAIVGHILPGTDPIHKISVVSRGMALGFTWSVPLEDLHLSSKEKFEDQIAQMLAGRVAEEIQFNSITTGASNDLKNATKIARDMVTRYGMSDEIGPMTLGEKEELIFLGKELAEHKTYSEKSAALIDQEVSDIINEAKKRAYQVLAKHKKMLKQIAEKLLKEETIEGEDFARLFK